MNHSELRSILLFSSVSNQVFFQNSYQKFLRMIFALFNDKHCVIKLIKYKLPLIYFFAKSLNKKRA